MCGCACHAGCALAGRRTAQREEWRPRCTCPGAAQVWQVEDRAEERAREMAGVVAEVRRTGLRDAGEVEERLRAVYLARGEPAPPGLAGLARLRAAATARRGTRIPRVLWLGAQGFVRTVRWAWGPPGDDPETEHNRVQSRTGYRVVGVVAGVAAVLSVTASRSSGGQRWTSGVAAAAAWLVTGWSGLLMTVVTGIARAADEHRSGGPDAAAASPAGDDLGA